MTTTRKEEEGEEEEEQGKVLLTDRVGNKKWTDPSPSVHMVVEVRTRNVFFSKNHNRFIEGRREVEREREPHSSKSRETRPWCADRARSNSKRALTFKPQSHSQGTKKEQDKKRCGRVTFRSSPVSFSLSLPSCLLMKGCVCVCAVPLQSSSFPFFCHSPSLLSFLFVFCLFFLSKTDTDSGHLRVVFVCSCRTSSSCFCPPKRISFVFRFASAFVFARLLCF